MSVDPDRPRAIQRLVLFLRRRRREALLAAGCFLALSFTAHAFPRRWVAEAIVTPRGLTPYAAPVERLVAGATGTEALERAATAAGVTTAASVLELMETQPGLEERLGVRTEVRRSASGALEGVVLHAEAPGRYQAEQLVRSLARELIQRNEQEAAGQPAGSEPGGPTRPTVAPALQEARQRLAALRERTPSLREPSRAADLHALERALSEDRIALTTWEARADAAAAATGELEQAVRREAQLAWQAERARPAPAPVTPAQPAPAPQGPARAPTRLEQLEAELVRLLATRTDRHPDVRRLLREIEAEREAERARSQAEPPLSLPGRQEPVAVPGQAWVDRPVLDRAADADGLKRVADGQPAQEPPPAFLQRAPSYGAWVAARSEEAQARREVEVRRRSLDARRGEHARLEAEEATLARVRAEEAALVRQVTGLEQQTAQAPGEPAASRRAEAAGVAPLELAAAPRLTPLTWAPWSTGEGVLLALGLALLAGWVVDMFDRSYYQVEELSDLSVPVLGVIPHLRGR